MVVALITIFGVEFEVLLRRKSPPRPSIPPAGPGVIDTTAEDVPGPLAKPRRLELVRAA